MAVRAFGEAAWIGCGLADRAGGAALADCFALPPGMELFFASGKAASCRREEGSGIALSSKLRREAGGGISAGGVSPASTASATPITPATTETARSENHTSELQA